MSKISLSDRQKGMISIILSAFCFAWMNAFVRLSGDLPFIEKSFFRNFVALLLALVMLLQKNATVTICHTKTTDMPSVVKEADIVIVAAGRAGVIDAKYLRAGQTVIDVGINVNEEGKLCGDVNFADAEPVVDAITPVPGGVGSVTTSVLVEHVVDAALLKAGLDIL